MAKQRGIYLKSKRKNGAEKSKGRQREKKICNRIVEEETKEIEDQKEEYN